MAQFFLRFDQMDPRPMPTRQQYLSIRSWFFCLAGIVAYSRYLKLIPMLTALFLAQASYGQPSESLVVNNAMIMDPGDNTTSVRVNIVITNGVLEIVTEDIPNVTDEYRSLDASEGFVVGSLNLGEPASFMILKGDPRKDIVLLLDTKKYSEFAVYKGKVVKNTLTHLTTANKKSDDTKKRGWLAYTPPPLAVPLDYRDTSKWNRFETKYVSGLVTGGVLLDRQRWMSQNNASDLQVGDLKDFDGGEIRALRFGVVGTINLDTPWIWTIAGATNAFDKGFDQRDLDDFTIYDLRLDVPLPYDSTLSIGKQKEPISMERLMPLVNTPMQERAALLDSLLPARNVGMVLSSSLANQRMTFAGGVFNNWLDKDQPGFEQNSNQAVTRVTWVPFENTVDERLIHLGAGYRYSSGGEQGLLALGPEFNSAPEFSQTDIFEPKSLDTYSLEASLRSGPVWLYAEYLLADIDDEALNNPSPSGYFVTASWILTGEVRGYNHKAGLFRRIQIARTVDQNGWGAVELATRFSHTDFTDLPDATGGDAGKIDIWSLGANWWLSPYLNFTLDYRYQSFDRLGVDGDSHGINSRIMIVLE
jgi:phosphate-selective porin OprO/OprP